MRGGMQERQKRWLPRTAHEVSRYLARLAALLAVCDLAGALVVTFANRWNWDLATGIATATFVAAIFVFLMLLGEVYGYSESVVGSRMNPSVLESVVDARQADLGESVSEDAWWAILGGTLLLIVFLFVASAAAGLFVSVAMVPLGGAAAVYDHWQRADVDSDDV